MPLVYDELRAIASAYWRKESNSVTLDPTEIVHETWLALSRSTTPWFENRAHFYGIAARLMRQWLVARARSKQSQKRGGVRVHMSDELGCQSPDIDLMMLDMSLDRLQAIDRLGARIVELRYFGGLTHEEVAEVLEMSRSTVTRKWRSARAWLSEALNGGW